MDMRKTIVVAALALAAGSAGAAENRQQAALPDQMIDEIRAWASDPAVIAAIQEQNAEHAGLDQAEIDAMDQQWRAQTGAADKPMIDAILGNALSGYLAGVKEQAAGLYNEIFVMDAVGLNVGQSDITSDYWQGDEAKWQETYQAGPDAVFVDEVEFDESTQSYQSQVSVAIADPDSGAPIGAVTVGINVDAVE